MDFTIDGVAYKARKMDAFEQLRVLSKLSPLLTSGLPELLPLLREIRTRGVRILDLPLEESIATLGPLAREIAKMGDDDRRAIIEPCLDVVEKDIGGSKFAPVWNRDARVAMQADIREDAFLMLRIVFAVISGTFARFFPVNPSGSNDGVRSRSSIQ